MEHKNLDEYLKNTKMTVLELAAACGVKQPTISNLRHGRYHPSPQLAAKIEKITGIPLRTLLGLESSENHKKG